MEEIRPNTIEHQNFYKEFTTNHTNLANLFYTFSRCSCWFVLVRGKNVKNCFKKNVKD